MKYLDSRAKVFGHLDRLAGWNRGETPAPVTVEWDLSNRCALGCQDCHFAHTHVKGPWAVQPRLLPMAFEETGDLADLVLVGRALREMAAADVQGLVWSGGGEPTTHPSWTKALGLADRAGLQQGMYTFGGLLTADSAAIARALCLWIVVSLDCADAETYAREKRVPADRFDAACRGVRWLSGGSAAIGVSFLLHRENYTRAWDMLALARALGATYTTFRPAIRTNPDHPGVCADDRGWITAAPLLFQQLALEPDVEIDPARFLAYARWSGHGYASCQGVQLTTTITPDGRVWMCPQRRGVTPLGDLRQESFAAIWARHPRSFAVDAGCRVMCRLHAVNEQLAAIRAPRRHEAFL